MSRTSVSGISTVARGELKQRLRAGRWRWVLAAWFVVLVGFTALLRLALARTEGIDRSGVGGDQIGPPLFGGLLLFVLGLALLVMPALTAQSINGDRERGVLAPLQLTLLTPWDIALGKLVAAWGAALVFLALAVPCAVWAVAEGGVGLGNLVGAMGVVAVLLGVVCATSLGLSAVLGRSTTSAVMSYLAVFALTVGTMVAFGLALGTTQTEVRAASPPGEPEYDVTYTQTRSDRVWGLLAPNPFVILADAAPRLPERIDPETGGRITASLDPLGEIGRAVRELRLPPEQTWVDYSASYEPLDPGFVASSTRAVGPRPSDPGPVWPYGLAFNLLLAAGAMWVTARRLRTPSHKLRRGVRVA